MRLPLLVAFACSLQLSPRSALAQAVMIDWQHARQSIDGFGAAQPALGHPPLGPDDFDPAAAIYNWSAPYRAKILDIAYSTFGDGVGLSIFRGKVPTSLEPSPGVWNTAAAPQDPQTWLMTEVVKRSAVKLVASIWTPPAWMKTNGTLYGSRCSISNKLCDYSASDPCPNGGGACLNTTGALSISRYADFAEYILRYTKDYATNNSLSIYAISIANEPNAYVPWDSCAWTGGGIAAFLGTHLAPRLAASNVTSKVIAPEPSDWAAVEECLPEDATTAPKPLSCDPCNPNASCNGFLQPARLLDATYSTPAAKARLDIVAGHGYNDRYSPLPVAMSNNKRIWQTEVSITHPVWTMYPGALDWAEDIHRSLTERQVNAWLFWTLFYGNAGAENAALIGHLLPLSYDVRGSKALYAIGNYSKFIRPGFTRVDTPATGLPNGVLVSAYRQSSTGDPTLGQLVVVVINKNTSSKSITIQTGYPMTATPYETSTSRDLARLPDVSLGSAVTLAPQSVTTYVWPPPHQTADVLWARNDGAASVWPGALSSSTYSTTLNTAGLVFQGTGDFDGDGTSDILWRNPADSSTQVWFHGNSTTIGYPGNPGTLLWQIQGVGDFDGNGKSDILWRSLTGGEIAIWYDGNSSRVSYPGNPGTFAWQIRGVGDFDGNGRCHIFWRNDDGHNAIWFNGSPTIQSFSFMSTAYQVGALGNFDGDALHTSDVFWRTADGTSMIWYGASPATSDVPGNPGTLWQVRGAGDFDADGASDLFWVNQSAGATAIWYSGHSVRQSWPGHPGQNWTVAGVSKSFD